MSKTSPGLLRARRRDVCVKPNRVLDKSSSRGMIYENEELRIRTININAEIERGQSEVKKLRRENEHLKREIWSLREEVDRLEALLKHKEEVEDEETTDAEDEEEDEDIEEEEVPRTRTPRVAVEPDGLSVVQEEPEETTPEPNDQAQACINLERGVERYKGVLPPCIRLNCVHPFTAASTLPPSLANVTVMEVIESCQKMSGGVVGVRLLEGSLYVSTKSRQDLEPLLSQGLVLRSERLLLQDVSQGTVVLAMSGIPHGAGQEELGRLLSQFGPVIGSVERRVYRGADTGEGLVRLRPLASLPKRLFLDGAEISLRPLCHEELSKLSMHQHYLSKQPSSLFIKVEREGIEVKLTDTAKTSTTNVRNEPFAFPVPATPSSTPSTPKHERCHSAPVGTPASNGSTQSLRPHSDTEAKRPRRLNSRRGKSPSSSSEQDSPSKPRRRPSAVDRERSASLSSTSFRRKMSYTGREGGKLPWCACWGNGCI